MPQKWSLADCQHGGKTAKLPVNLPAASATRAVKWAESFILGHHPVCRWLRPATKPRNLRLSFYIVVTVRWETLRIEHSNNKRRSTMSIMNHLHALRTSGRSIQSKPGLLERFARACWKANQRIYVLATTDTKTGRTDLAVERPVALMMLG
jgi:hypothetical protein